MLKPSPTLTPPFLAGKALDTPSGPVVVEYVKCTPTFCRLRLSDGSLLNKAPDTGWRWIPPHGVLAGYAVRLQPHGFRRATNGENLMAEVAATLPSLLN